MPPSTTNKVFSPFDPLPQQEPYRDDVNSMDNSNVNDSNMNIEQYTDHVNLTSDHNDHHDMEAPPPSFTNEYITTETETQAINNPSNRSGRTRNTILGPLYKTSFLLSFITIGITLGIIGITISISSSNSNSFTWPPPVVHYDPANAGLLTETLQTQWHPTILQSNYESDKTYYMRTTMMTQESIEATGIGALNTETRFTIDSQFHVNDADATTKDKKETKSTATQVLEYIITHLHLTQSTNDNTILDIDTNDSKPTTQHDLLFLKEMIGHTTTIAIDSDGKIVESDEHDGLVQAIDANHVPNQLSASQQYRSIGRFTQLLPGDGGESANDSPYPSSSHHKVVPGDNWDFQSNVNGNDSTEYYSDHVFTGQAKLLGYTVYDGVDVAVITFSAIIEDMELSLDMDDWDLDIDDEEVFEEELGVDDETLYQEELEKHTLPHDGSSHSHSTKDATIKNGKLEAILYWDFEHHYPRWYRGDINLVLSIPNPLMESLEEGDTDVMMDVPTHEEFEIYMKMKN